MDTVTADIEFGAEGIEDTAVVMSDIAVFKGKISDPKDKSCVRSRFSDGETESAVLEIHEDDGTVRFILFEMNMSGPPQLTIRKLKPKKDEGENKLGFISSTF